MAMKIKKIVSLIMVLIYVTSFSVQADDQTSKPQPKAVAKSSSTNSGKATPAPKKNDKSEPTDKKSGDQTAKPGNNATFHLNV